MLDDSDIVANLAAMRPHRERYLLLTQSLGRRLVRTYRDWIDEVERELG
jgi:hypothetical protein